MMLKFILLIAVLCTHTAFSSETLNGAQKDLAAFKKEMAIKIDSIEKEISDLKTKAKTKGKSVTEETIQDLEATRDDLKLKMNELGDSSKDRWKAMKKSLSETADSLHAKLQKALKD